MKKSVPASRRIATVEYFCDAINGDAKFPTVIETTTWCHLNKFRLPRFTIASLLLLTAVVAFATLYIRTSAELSRVKLELAALQRELFVLVTDDDSKIYATSLPTFGPLQWRWKIQLPSKGEYRLRYAIDQFPVSGLPRTSHAIDDAFFDPYRKPLPGGVPFTFDIGIYKNESGVWMFNTRNGACGRGVFVPNPPAWLDGPTTAGYGIRLFGLGETVSADFDSPLPLLHYTKAGGSIHIWIERI